MSFLKTIPLNQAKDEVLDLYQRQQTPYGYVPNYAKVWCYRPELMQAWAELQRGIKKRVDFKEYELVTFAAAVGMGNTGCSLAHAKALLQNFYSAEDVVEIIDDNGAKVLSPREQAMVKFAKRVVGRAADIREHEIDELRAAGCSEEDIFDVVIIASARCFFAKIHDALGVLSDSPANKMDKTLLDRLVMGRTISTQPVESLP